MTVGQSTGYTILLLESVDMFKVYIYKAVFTINRPELNNWYIKLPHGHVSMLN